MRQNPASLTNLMDVIDQHLGETPRLPGKVSAMPPGIGEVRTALANFRRQIGEAVIPARVASPRCGGFDSALALTDVQSGGAMAKAITAAMPCLDWISYDAYPSDQIGSLFPRQHAFASLASVYDPGYALDFDLGLLLIAPGTLYRDHRHQAAELYLPLTGPSRWRFGADSPWVVRYAGEPVWNPPYALHATLVERIPLLCLYAWTRDVLAPAEIVPAPDWTEIEAGLTVAV